MDIKTTQLKNNTQLNEISSSNVRTPAKVTENGKSFIDEIANLPKIEVVDNIQQNPIAANDVKSAGDKNSKAFEFVPTQENNFVSVANKENLTVLERQAKHKAAEKELVDEIVLMNSKQNIENKKVAVDSINDDQNLVIQNLDNHTETENSEIIKPEFKDLPEVLTIAEGSDTEFVFPEKNAVEEIFEAPEMLEQFEEPINIVKQDIKEDISLIDIDTSNADKANAEGKLFGKPLVSTEKAENIPLVEQSLKNIPAEKAENVPVVEQSLKNIPAEKAENVSVVEQSLKNIPAEKVENVSVVEQSLKNIPAEKVENVLVAEQSEKNKFVENIVNKNNIDKNKNIKNEKLELNKVLNVTNDNSDVETIGKTNDISDKINVKAIDIKQAPIEDIKVIKMEVVNPLAELNNSMNTTKTSDIVKFIDANLATEATKKSSSSKSTEASKKDLSEKTIKMTEADAKFFNSLIETNQQVIEGTKTAEPMNNNLLKDVEAAQSSQVSKALLNALKESQETNKSFRVDFNKDISVVLRVNKDGQISAEFIPGDEAVEQYLKANIPLLKQKFTDEGLEYDNLSYRQNKKEQNEEKERQSRGNKKENGYE